MRTGACGTAWAWGTAGAGAGEGPGLGGRSCWVRSLQKGLRVSAAAMWVRKRCLLFPRGQSCRGFVMHFAIFFCRHVPAVAAAAAAVCVDEGLVPLRLLGPTRIDTTERLKRSLRSTLRARHVEPLSRASYPNLS